MNMVLSELWHFKIGPDDQWDLDDERQGPKEIGIYSTQANAEAAIDRVRGKSGFRDWPHGFRIIERALDQDHWGEGFINPYDDPEWPRPERS